MIRARRHSSALGNKSQIAGRDSSSLSRPFLSVHQVMMFSFVFILQQSSAWGATCNPHLTKVIDHDATTTRTPPAFNHALGRFRSSVLLLLLLLQCDHVALAVWSGLGDHFDQDYVTTQVSRINAKTATVSQPVTAWRHTRNKHVSQYRSNIWSSMFLPTSVLNSRHKFTVKYI